MSRRSSRYGSIAAVALVPALFASAVASCSTDDSTDKAADAPAPSYPSSDSAGPGGGGDPSNGDQDGASGTDAAGTDATTPTSCPDAQKLCAVDFSYSNTNVNALVELRGDWEPTKWASGLPMTNFGPNWRRTLYLAPGSKLEYKFCIDPKSDGTCSDWQSDSSKPTVGPNGNNVIANVSCSQPVCAPTTTTGTIKESVLRFAAIGDTGYDGQDAVSVALGNKCQTSGCDFVLLLGDNVYDDGVSSADDYQLTSKFENRFAPVHAPFFVILGNHDYGGNGDGSEYAKGQFEVDYTQHSKKWRMPNRYYKFSAPAGDVDFFGLDTNAQMYSLDGQQKTDVKSWLASSKALWKIAFGHHPYKSNGPHGNAGVYDNDPNRPVFNGVEVKAFAEDVYCGNTDLYLCGHDHTRQWMTDTCKGTELAVSGAGVKTTSLPGNDPTRFQSLDVGFLYVTIDGKKLTAEFINSSGAVDFTRVLQKP